ncbi:Transthyretin-like family protein [Necator americanus]|uniref:Transthyretin-like family protein n=1 Tax=Necator americanus TaxID=51031 RepID=W2SH28_NECAM|nr:Transthyretin-like family protein [Necator americanus]ETN68900.1 Transthyretin-like family protein [Necator americanus]
MRLWQTVAIYLLVCFGVCLAMRKQGVAVRGVLKCGSVPANYSKVRIVDIDYGPDPDDTLDEKRTDERGRFEPCSRKIKFTIPKKFIHNGNPTPEQWIDIGVINLEGAFDDEGRECVN